MCLMTRFISENSTTSAHRTKATDQKCIWSIFYWTLLITHESDDGALGSHGAQIHSCGQGRYFWRLECVTTIIIDF